MSGTIGVPEVEMFERPGCVHGLVAALSLVLVGCFKPVGNNASDASTGPGSSGDTAGGTDAPTTASGLTTTDAPGTTGEATTTGVSTTTGASATSSTDTGAGDCGNGMVDPGEECDDGEGNGPAAQCTPECQRAKCGDGYVCDACSPVEECDDKNDMGGDGCENECTLAKCGDGKIGTNEECEPPALGVCSSRCTFALQRLFVTFDKYAGVQGGLAGADLLCRTLGRTKYTRKREFVAWLSGDAPLETAAMRIGSTENAYLLPSENVVALNTADLLDGSLLKPIDETEQGTQAMPDTSNCSMAGVWTGTASDGTSTAGATCGGWAEQRVMGTVGNFTATDGGWTNEGTCGKCGSETQRFYCIEKVVP